MPREAVNGRSNEDKGLLRRRRASADKRGRLAIRHSNAGTNHKPAEQRGKGRWGGEGRLHGQ